MKYTRILVIAVLVIALALIIVTQYSPLLFSKTSLNEAYVTLNGKLIVVEVADEPDAMRQGLMFRESLPKDRGMLFVFDGEGIHSFWMMNVKFSLDIVWIDRNGVVVHIERDLPPCLALCPSYYSNSPAKYVLEVNSGFADENGLGEGARVEIPLTGGS